MSWILEISGLNKRYGALGVIRDLDLRLAKGERRAIIGPNGAGKTTLFNLISGHILPDSGEIRFASKLITRAGESARARLGLGRSFQKNNLFCGLTVWQNLELAGITARRCGWIFWRRSFALTKAEQTAPPDTRALLDIAARTGLSDVLHMPVEALAYGVRRQLEIALALAVRPELLMLDEPTSGMGTQGTARIMELVENLPRDLSLLIIEHDMDVVFHVADCISVLNYGEVLFTGTPEAARSSVKVQEVYLGGGKEEKYAQA